MQVPFSCSETYDDSIENGASSGLLKNEAGKKTTYSPRKGLKMIKDHFYQSWYRLEDLIDREYFKDPHLGLRIAGVDFQEPYLRCQETTIIALAVMRLLIKFVYNT